LNAELLPPNLFGEHIAHLPILKNFKAQPKSSSKILAVSSRRQAICAMNLGGSRSRTFGPGASCDGVRYGIWRAPIVWPTTFARNGIRRLSSIRLVSVGQGTQGVRAVGQQFSEFRLGRPSDTIAALSGRSWYCASDDEIVLSFPKGAESRETDAPVSERPA
jgi:hypothetical protein